MLYRFRVHDEVCNARDHRLSLPTAPPLPLLGFDAYRSAVSQSVVPLDVHTNCPDDFGGYLDSGGAGDIHVFHIRADEHAVHRSHSLIARGTSKYYKFSLLLEGDGLIVQEGRETALRAGDMAIYDTDRPYSLVFDETVRMGTVMFPKELIELPAEAVRELTARRFTGDDGIGAMVRPYLAQLVQQSDGLDGHLARRLARSAVDLVGTLLEEHAAERPVHRRPRGDHAPSPGLHRRPSELTRPLPRRDRLGALHLRAPPPRALQHSRHVGLNDDPHPPSGADLRRARQSGLLRPVRDDDRARQRVRRRGALQPHVPRALRRTAVRAATHHTAEALLTSPDTAPAEACAERQMPCTRRQTAPPCSLPDWSQTFHRGG